MWFFNILSSKHFFSIQEKYFLPPVDCVEGTVETNIKFIETMMTTMDTV